ncbi:MAG: YaiI/YqxD family protein [bacterium]|nr:YaiI/YqxD family protein [bacterium]
MKILVDADACPVKEIIEDIASNFKIPVIMIIDTSHELYSNYSEIIQVSKAPDAVDLALFNRTSPGDIVVTHDYGVASMVLGKKAYAINNNGKWFTNQNIDVLMYERHIAAKQRKMGVHSCSMKKRSKQDDQHFRDGFTRLCIYALKREKEMHEK